MTLRTWFWLAALVTTSGLAQVAADGFLTGATKVDVLPAYKKALSENGSLALGNVDVVKLTDGSCALVVVGTKVNQALKSPTPQAYLKNRMLARLEAEKVLATYLGSTVTTEQRMQKTETTVTTQRADGSVERAKRVEKSLQGMTVEQAEAKLRGAITAGTWFSEGEQFFHLALAFPAGCTDIGRSNSQTQ